MSKNYFRWVIACLLLGALALSSAFAQTVTGAITGVVTDPSGALVAGATVTAMNTGTGVSTTAQTDGAGVYNIRFLPIGSYTLTVDAKGFSTEKLEAFALEIDQTAKINIALKIASAETAVVTERVHPILDTTDSTLGNTLTTTEIENIPLNGRNFSSLTLFQPGAVDSDPQGLTGQNAIERDTFNNGVVTVNGNREQANNYTIEGADDNEPQNNLIAYNPAPDAIAEVRVVSANANASYGNANGGAVVTILKSGTNNYHGSGYDLLQSQILNANSWSNDFQVPIVPKSSYTQNIFGGTIGGPILKNKLFFFADYEGVRHRTSGTASDSLLTPQMLAGNFSALEAQGIQLFDSQNNFAPFLNDQVPVVNPVAKYLAAHPNLYPAPNATPTDGLIQNNFQGPQSGFVSNNQEDFKVDFTPERIGRINGFYSQGTGSDFTTSLIPVAFPFHNTYPTRIGGASFVHTFSPYIVNEFRFGFTRVHWNNMVPSDPSGLFGLTGDQTVGIPFPGAQRFVGFTDQNVSNHASTVGTNANPQAFADNTFNYSDNLTWQHGRHYFTMGGQATRYQQNYVNASNVGFLGQFSYNGQFTSDPAISANGYGPADFVLGEIQNTQLASPQGLVGNRQWRFAGYFQDDLKVTSRLTVNLGLRYEYDQPWYEQNDKTANVLPNNTVEYAGSIPAGAAPGSVLCPTNSCYKGSYNQFQPRLGFAYQALNKLVIRGGYGATSFFEGYSFNQRLTSSPPFSQAININANTPTNTSGGTPFTVANAFAQPFGINNSLYSVWPQNIQPAYIQQFTLDVEYALTNELSLSVAYHGQIGNHLSDFRNGNQLTPAQAQIATPIINANPNTPCSNLSFPASAQGPYYRLEGECNPVLVTESEARSTYNSGQVTLRQRTHHGLEYTLNYTYAKSLSDSSGNYSIANTSFNGDSVQNGFDLNADYGPTGIDVRHNLNFVGVYEVPFGHGKTYGGSANRWVDSALGGWKVSTSAILFTGLPVTIFGNNNSNTNNAGFGFSRANQYRPLAIRHQSLDHWFGTDPSAVPCLGAGVDDGTCAYGNAANFTFGTASNSTERAPGYRQVDLSLFKDFHAWQEQVVGFRADFFNIFNIASYGNPDNTITDSNFGQINNTRSPSRSIQLSLHYIF